MKQTVNFTGFCDAFSETYRNNFSYEAKRALFEFIEEIEEQTGTETELDIVSLCCDYNELTYEEVAREYSILDDEDAYSRDTIRQIVSDYLHENTTVVAELDNTVVFAAF